VQLRSRAFSDFSDVAQVVAYALPLHRILAGSEISWRKEGTTVASLRVRYRNGDTDEWHLAEQMDTQELADHLRIASAKGHLVGFGVPSEVGERGVDYGWAMVRMSEVVMLHIEGMVNLRGLAMWTPSDDQ
jgi:hypothetical protein